MCLNANAQLSADFSSDVQHGCSPLVVQFTDISTGGPTEWYWDLGNGAISTQQNAGAIYINPGNYTVKLYVKNATGEDTVIKTDYITVYEDPTIAFTATPTEGCAPLPVQFSDFSQPGSGEIESWTWDFGDGVISSEKNPMHTYAIIDTFNVNLTVVNSFGCKESLQRPSFIKIGSTATAGFTYSYVNACKPPSTVTFTNTSTSNQPLTYQWIFGDGATSTEKDPVHIYTFPGDFIVQLEVTNSIGCRQTFEQEIAIGSAKADFDFTATCLDEPVTFTDSSTPVPLNSNWDFGDGITGTGYTVNHVYQNAGTYQVTLIADFGDCSDTTSKTLVINKKPGVNFSVAGSPYSCTFPFSVQFKNASSGATGYKWVFGDGTVSAAPNPTHDYLKRGKYTVSLIAYNASGCSDTITKEDFIQVGPPQIQSIENLPFEGCIPQTLTLRPVIDFSKSITSYLWDFGDGTTSADSVPTHQYTTAGKYDVTLIVATADGCADTLLIENAVSVGNAPTPAFSADPLNTCAQYSIHFTDESTGPVTNWLWFFGDGSVSASQNPIYAYSDTGYFDVTLVVSQYGCYDTLIKENYIYINPPIAKFTSSLQCSDPFTFTFTDNSIGPESWLWNFGDGSTSTDQSPKHTYSSPGVFPVSLTVTNGICSYTEYDSVRVIQENPVIEYRFLEPNSCKYDSVIFFVTRYDSSNIKAFQWNFGDGITTPASIRNDTVYHYYSEAGNYLPMLILKDVNNCVDTIRTGIQLPVYGPNAVFSNKPGDCIFSTISFQDASTTDGQHAITTWIWDYGDGSNPDTLTAPPFKHKYDVTGVFNVSLKVTDNNNCYDTVTNIKALTITQPVAGFSALNSTSCSGSPIQFIDSSSGTSLVYNWNFGDGQFSSDPEPLHQYASEGTYDVKLILTDKFGCADSVLKPQYILVANPIANFTLTDSIFLCPPVQVTPQNVSLNYNSLIWDFGDGNTSSEVSPEHIYFSAGIYTLKLIVTGFGNCYDTLSKPIVIKGPSATLSYSPLSGCDSLNVSFSANAVNTIRYIWDFGNGVTQTTLNSNVGYNYLSPGKFLPQLVIVDSSGCQVAVVNQDTVVISSAKAYFSAIRNTGYCDSSLYEFIDSSQVSFDKISSYDWDFGDGNFSVKKQPQHYYTTAGLYQISLSITTENGCRADYTLPLNVAIDSTPRVLATIPDSACMNEVIMLSAAVVNNSPVNFSWQWNLGDGNYAYTNDTIYAYNTAKNYAVTVTATSLTGCAGSATQALRINPLPPINAGIDSVICKGESIALMATGANEYTWLPDASLSCLTCANPVASPLVNTTYFVTGTNNFKCVAEDSITIEVKQPASVSIEAPDTACTGTTIELKATGAEQYTWEPASSVTDSQDSVTSATPTVTTTFFVTGQDSKGCFSDRDSITVYVFPIPTVAIQDSAITISAGSEYQVNIIGSEDIISWRWQPPSGLSCIDCPNPVIKPKNSQTYTVEVRNIAGCSAQDDIRIIVLCKDQNLFIPNTFSPNADGMNDYFYPRGKGLSNIKSFRIFNRWGIVVYERTNFPPNQQSYGWNGTYNGKALQSDVYVFVVEVSCESGQVLSSKGNVTLLR